MASGKTRPVDDYARGRRDGLRLALAVLCAEEAKWTALLGESRSWRTNATREVRDVLPVFSSMLSESFPVL